jgi:hypothetical protein
MDRQTQETGFYFYLHEYIVLKNTQEQSNHSRKKFNLEKFRINEDYQLHPEKGQCHDIFFIQRTQSSLIHTLKPFCVLLQFAEDNSALWTTAGSQLFLQAGANLRPGSAVFCFSYSATFYPSFL